MSARKYNMDNMLTVDTKKYMKVIFVMLALVFLLGGNPLVWGVALFVRHNIVQPFRIPSASMMPTIIKGDGIFVDNMIYKKTSPKRWDIIVFKWEKTDKRYVLYRIVGMPNETIEIKNGNIYINGLLQSKPDSIKNVTYINNGTYGDYDKKTVIPEDCYFALGDNNTVSADSRYHGFIRKDNIAGKVYKIFMPFERSGPVK